MKTSNQEQLDSILRAIIEEPDVDLHRLVYADYLEEHQSDNRDSMEHAALIRKQLRVGGEQLWHDKFSNMKLLYRRGFVEEITLTYQQWREVGVEMVQECPLRRVWTSDKTQRGDIPSLMYRNYQNFLIEYGYTEDPPYGTTDIDDDIWCLLPFGSPTDAPWWKSYGSASRKTVHGYLSDAMIQWAKSKALQSRILVADTKVASP